MACDVKIYINTIKTVGNIGFGCPLILEENAETAKDYAVYTDVSELVTAGYAVDSDVYKVAQLMFMQEYPPQKIAVCSTTDEASKWVAEEKNVSKDWRQLVVLGASTPNVSDIMTAIEAQTKYPKFYYANVPLEYAETLTVEGIERTLVCFYTPTEDLPVPVAAIAGNVGGCQVGSYTINNMKIKGVPALELSDTEISAIHAKGGVTMVLSAGDCVVSEGKAVGGTYVDNTDNNDYIKQQLEYKLQKVFNDNLKVPYTNEGIAMLEGATVDVLKDAYNKGIIENGYTVDFKTREEVSEDERSTRKYTGGKITYSMQGAIHEIEVYCECKL